jgi:hypothetical protein
VIARCSLDMKTFPLFDVARLFGIEFSNLFYWIDCLTYRESSECEWSNECEDSPTGKHVFSEDYEYDAVNPPVNCEYCGFEKPGAMPY